MRGQKLELLLKSDGDSLGLDNAVAAMLPQTRPLVVAWVAEKADPFTELALSSMIESGRIEMLKGSPESWPLKIKPDVYVFENWLPEEWPAERPVIALKSASEPWPGSNSAACRSPACLMIVCAASPMIIRYFSE